MRKRLTLHVNGRDVQVAAEPDSMLLYALRDELGLHGPKFGCGLGQCGACTVVLDGSAIRSCITPVAAAGNGHITTLEGLGTVEHPGPLQQAFIDEQAVQCGYCMSGWIMTGAALLAKTANPSDAEIRTALRSVVCRCGAHMRIFRAVRRAAQARG